jgi:uncharacterized protein DUF6152
MTRAMLPLLLGLGVSAATAHAHHSISSVYDSSRPVTIDGTVSEFFFVNPHPYLVVTVRDASGQTRSWRLEMDNRRELTDIGMSETSFRAGDRVVVTGDPGRTQTQLLYVRALDRPADGFRYEQVGTSPRVRRSSR